MPTMRMTQVIGRPVADVFGTVIDAGNFASWNPTIKASRQLTPGAVLEGSQFEWELRGFGKVRQELQEFDRNRRVRIVPHSKAISGGHRFTFTELETGTRVDHELEMTPKGLFRLMAPMMAMAGRRNLAATAAALQRHLERGK
jgi:Polyketide cyclase / dehydrase and lipid transport